MNRGKLIPRGLRLRSVKWRGLFELSVEAVASLAVEVIGRLVEREAESELEWFARYLKSYLHPGLSIELLRACLEKDAYLCARDLSECLAFELWRVFYVRHVSEIDIHLHTHIFSRKKKRGVARKLHPLLNLLLMDKPNLLSSVKLDCKRGELGGAFQANLSRFFVQSAIGIRRVELPRMCTDKLLFLVALHCRRLEELNVEGSKVTDLGVFRFIYQSSRTLKKANFAKCWITTEIFPHFAAIPALHELHFSTGAFITRGPGGKLQRGPAKFQPGVLPDLKSVHVERETTSRLATVTLLRYLSKLCPNLIDVNLHRGLAYEFPSSVENYPVIMAYLRRTMRTMDLVSVDYYYFPELVYPCPNLETMWIENPCDDLFHFEIIPYENVLGEFVNLQTVKISRVNLVNLRKFLSKSKKLKEFRIFNVLPEERMDIDNENLKRVLPKSMKMLETVHISSRPDPRGFYRAADIGPKLSLTEETARYLMRNFKHMKQITGLETWNIKNRRSLDKIIKSKKSFVSFD